MEYASSVWSPFKHRDIKLIEGVQRRATRLSRDLRNEPYYIRLTKFGLPTLQFRRERADMLQVFKFLNGYEDIDSSCSKRHSLQAVELSQQSQDAVQIVSNLPTPSNGDPIYRFGHAGHVDPLDGRRCCSQKRVMSRPIQVRQL